MKAITRKNAQNKVVLLVHLFNRQMQDREDSEACETLEDILRTLREYGKSQRALGRTGK